MESKSCSKSLLLHKNKIKIKKRRKSRKKKKETKNKNKIWQKKILSFFFQTPPKFQWGLSWLHLDENSRPVFSNYYTSGCQITPVILTYLIQPITRS